MRLEDKEQKQNMYHQDDIVWDKGIMDMIARVVAATERGQRQDRKEDTECVCLEASIHTDLTQTGKPKKQEARQQQQPGRMLKSVPMWYQNPTQRRTQDQHRDQHRLPR